MLHSIFLTKRVLKLPRLADRLRITLLFLTRLKMWSQFVYPFLKWSWFIDIVLISLKSEHQPPNSYECSKDNSWTHGLSIVAQMLLNRNRILIVKVNISRVGRTLLRLSIGEFAGLLSIELPDHFNDSQRIKDDWGSAWKVFTTFVDLSASGICDLTSLSLVCIWSNWIYFCWVCFQPFVYFDCFLRCSDRL